MRCKIWRTDSTLNVLNASGKSVPIVGTINLTVKIWTNTEIVTFFSRSNSQAKSYSVPIFGPSCGIDQAPIGHRRDGWWIDNSYCSPDFESQYRRPTSRRTKLFHEENRSSPKIKTQKRVRLKPKTQTWIGVATKREGTILMVPY